MKFMSAEMWASDEFGQVTQRDPRCRKRLISMAAGAALRPAGRVAEVFRNDAERQGAYGLLESEAVLSSEVGASMFRACARRCAKEPFVFCAVDGSSLTLTDRSGGKQFGSVGARSKGAQGLKVISALAISPQGVPLGLTAQVWWVRSKRRAKKHHTKRAAAEKETGHWLEAMAGTREVMRATAADTRVWFQLDREADAWPILSQGDTDDHWFTVRGRHDRRVIRPDGNKTLLRTLLCEQRVVHRYRLSISSGPRRAERTAQLSIRACSATLQFRDRVTCRRFSKTVNVVLAREEGTTPAGEKPIEWLLLTNWPVQTVQDLQQIVYGYAQRWRIEEFHRTWKSGSCRVEESQLRSVESATKWAMILAAVAVRIERIKVLSRREPERKATDEFSATELRAITLLRFGKSAKQRFSDTVVPTLAQATLWVAQLGGYTGKSSGGPPGSIVIGRGLREVQAAVRTLEALEASCD
jgi:hypothetical protein